MRLGLDLLSARNPLVGLAAQIANDNLVADPFDVSAASWTNSGTTNSAANPYFPAPAIAPRYLASPGAANTHVFHTFGNLTAAMRGEWWLERQDSASLTNVLIRQNGVGQVCLASLNWNTSAFIIVDQTRNDGTPVLTNTLISASGPNGGEFRKLQIDCTPLTTGVAGSIWVYPTGSVAEAAGAVVHAVRLRDTS